MNHHIAVIITGIITLILLSFKTFCGNNIRGGYSSNNNEIAHLLQTIKFTNEEIKHSFIEEYNKIGIGFHKPVVKLSDFDQSLPYYPNQKIPKKSLHIGQRKLFLNEVQFCTNFIGDRPAIVVYAGAAPSNKGAFMASLFPNIKFIFVDPNKFVIISSGYPNIKIKHWSNFKQSLGKAEAFSIIQDITNTNYNINIINDIMTEDLSEAIRAHIDECYFISDIRTNQTEAEAYPDAADILWNNAQQLNWISIMKPIQSMLKFRHPFYAEHDDIVKRVFAAEPMKSDFAKAKKNGIDFIANYINGKQLTYFSGDMYLQPWAPISSTESRLVTDGKTFHNYGAITEYENKYFWYNNICRNYIKFENENSSWALGFDHCADCALENVIWVEYCKIMKSRRSVIDYVKELSKITNRGLLKDSHGRMF